MSDPAASSPLSRVLERARPESPSATRPVIVFDLDATLFDNRPRSLAILHELQSKLDQDLPDERALADAIDKITPEVMRYRVQDTLSNVGFEHEALAKRATSFWFARFFRNRYVRHDIPYPGALDYARACYDAGANLVYLTGRDVKGMLEGTVARLRDCEFPYARAGTQVILKPDAKASDEDFKRATLPALSRLGPVAAFFDNEPANCNIAEELLPTADIFWLDTQCRPDAPPLSSRVHTIRDFLLS